MIILVQELLKAVVARPVAAVAWELPRMDVEEVVTPLVKIAVMRVAKIQQNPHHVPTVVPIVAVGAVIQQNPPRALDVAIVVVKDVLRIVIIPVELVVVYHASFNVLNRA